MHDIRAFLGRGALAGLTGGGAAAAFHLLVTRHQINAALAVEAARQPDGEALLSRTTQVVGGAVGIAVYGTLLGVVFGFVLAALWPALPGSSVFARSIRLAGVAFVAWSLVPALKYPANPPGAGDPNTIGDRTVAYLFLVAVSVLLALLGAEGWRRLSGRGIDGAARFAVTAVAYGAMAAACLALFPDNTDPVELPVELIWRFRLDSILGNGVLWLVMGTVFGALGDRSRNSTAGLESGSRAGGRARPGRR